jgi:DNA-binding CsgD family transcriptional regulator
VSQQSAPPAPYPLEPVPPASPSRRRRLPRPAGGLSWGQYARSLVRRLAALTAVLLAAIWALTGQGYFWPAWAWLGLLVVVLCDYAAGWVWRRPPGAPRRVACVWAAIGVAAVILVMTWLLTWLLAGVHAFWPAWALLGLATAGAAYSSIALHDRVLVANGGRALRRHIAVAKVRAGALRAFLGAQRRLARDGVVLDRESVNRLLRTDGAAMGTQVNVGSQADMGLQLGPRDEAALGLPAGALDALDRSGLDAGSAGVLERLTGREREVLELMAAGRSNGAIAERLVVSLGAIEKHITNIFTKLDLPACEENHRRVLAVLVYLRFASR